MAILSGEIGWAVPISYYLLRWIISNKIQKGRHYYSLQTFVPDLMDRFFRLST